jgi:hypothetical protein
MNEQLQTVDVDLTFFPNDAQELLAERHPEQAVEKLRTCPRLEGARLSAGP